ncbi:hypothetical protein F5Y14DRAFT_410477 [Nemania sp. NC0429]|nr:hypothetical protein F5Y14DRAFT_410477 [Nemania sp. NC0429]
MIIGVYLSENGVHILHQMWRSTIITKPPQTMLRWEQAPPWCCVYDSFPFTPRLSPTASPSRTSFPRWIFSYSTKSTYQATKSHMEELFSVSTRNVDPAELVRLLRDRFGRGGFRIEMRHSTYRVYAHRGRAEADRYTYCLLRGNRRRS